MNGVWERVVMSESRTPALRHGQILTNEELLSPRRGSESNQKAGQSLRWGRTLEMKPGSR